MGSVGLMMAGPIIQKGTKYEEHFDPLSGQNAQRSSAYLVSRA